MNLFDALLDPALYWEKNPAGVIVLARANSAANRLWPANQTWPTGEAFERIFVAVPELGDAVQQAFHFGTTLRKTLQLSVAGGEHGLYQVDILAVDEGCVLTSFRRLTESPHIEAIVSSIHREFSHALLETAPFPILIISVERVVQLANQACLDLLGISNGLVGSQPVSRLFPAAAAELLLGHVSQVIASGRAEYWQEGISIGGEDRYFKTIGYPMKDHAGNLKSVGVTLIEFTEVMKAEARVRDQQQKLQVHLKEIDVLYRLSDIANQTLDQIIDGVTQLLPQAFQYPEITRVQVFLDGQVFRTSRFRPTAWKLERSVEVDGKNVGLIEVYYLEDRPDAFLGPFLSEEVKLLAIVSERLGRIVEGYESQKEIARRVNEIAALENVTANLRNARTPAEMFPILLTQTLAAIPSEKGALILIENSGLRVVAMSGRRTGEERILRQVQKMYHSDHPPRENQPDWVDEPISRTFLLPMAPDLSEIIMPIFSSETAIGFLYLARNAGEVFSQDETSVLVSIAGTAGNAIQRAGLMEILEKKVAARTRELSALYDLATIANEATALEGMLENVLHIVLKTAGCVAGMIHLYNSESNCLLLSQHTGISQPVLEEWDTIHLSSPDWTWAIQENAPRMLTNLENSAGAQPDLSLFTGKTYIGCPLRIKGSPVGLLSLFSEQDQNLGVEELLLLSAISDQISLGVESVRIRKKSEQTLIYAERQRLARDLHDSISQSMYSLVLFAGASRQLASTNGSVDLLSYLTRIEDTSHQALRDLRLLVYELRPDALQEAGLAGALRQRLEAVEKRAGMEAHLDVSGQAVLPEKVETALYRIAQEALNNSLKHARATKINVQIHYQPDAVELEIADNGQGLDIKDAQGKGGAGLKNMQTRADEIGAVFSLHTYPGEGTVILVHKEMADE
jgi:signal transduction histidine kinase/PAS domain-containing protein